MPDQRFQRLAEYISETDADVRISERERSRRHRELRYAWARLEIELGSADGKPPGAMPAWAASFHPVGPPS